MTQESWSGTVELPVYTTPDCLCRVQTASPALSSETRNVIYKLVVVSTESIRPLKYCITKTRVLDLDIPDNSKHDEHHLQPSMTKVSRQLRQEALSILLQRECFRFRPICLRLSLPTLSKFMNIGEDDLRNIRNSVMSRIKIAIMPNHSTFRATYPNRSIDRI
ncbi:hypothetical protein E2P81_ATG09578 [Venturia nashicola]|nr:hypothetical protein E2P81_ATG09578 [Venturia nashicola]